MILLIRQSVVDPSHANYFQGLGGHGPLPPSGYRTGYIHYKLHFRRLINSRKRLDAYALLEVHNLTF